MHLAPEEADQVMRLHRTLMRFVDERLAPLEVAGSAAGRDTSPTERQERLAEALVLRLDLIDAFIEANPAGPGRICPGIMIRFNIHCGPGMRRNLEEDYQENRPKVTRVGFDYAFP
jgi:hypothetical protein